MIKARISMALINRGQRLPSSGSLGFFGRLVTRANVYLANLVSFFIKPLPYKTAFDAFRRAYCRTGNLLSGCAVPPKRNTNGQSERVMLGQRILPNKFVWVWTLPKLRN